MASTITLSGDWLVSLGNRRQTYGTGNLGTYATNGVTVAANQLGLGVTQVMIIDPAGGYTFEYIPSTGKIKAYYVAGSTPSGTITGSAAAQTFTGESYTPAGTNTAPTITVTGTHNNTKIVSVSAGNALAGADDATVTGITGVQAPTFAGTAHTLAGTNSTSTITATFTGTGGSAGVQTEVTNGVDLSGTTFTFVAQGY